jgi:hypothetical protein
VIPCLELFSKSGLAGIPLQEAVDAKFPNGECEAVSASEHSPCPVDASETLIRLAFHPIHVDPNGRILSVAFTDAWRSDLSVFRDERASDGEIALAIEQMRLTGVSKTPPQDRHVAAAMVASTGTIRAQMVDGTSDRAFRVYDTAEEAKPHHASIFLTRTARSTLTEKSVRKRLYELFSVAAPNYRDGRLNTPPPS